MEVAEDDLALQEEHLSLEAVPLVEVLLADLLQVVSGLLPEQGPQLLLPLGGHESLLLGHGDGVLLPVLDGDESLAQFP